MAEHEQKELRRRWGPRVAAGAAIAAVILIPVILAITTFAEGGDPAAERLEDFLAAWSAGRDADAARMTDAPIEARQALEENRAGLDGATLRTTVEHPAREVEHEAFARVNLQWDIPAIGKWDYTVEIVMLKHPDHGWHVHWKPTVIHPAIGGPNARLGTVRRWPERGRILARDGTALVQSLPVKRVGVIAGEVERPRETAEAFAALFDIDPGPYARAIRGGGPQQFVEAIALRLEEYEALESELEDLPDVVVYDGSAQLAPTRDFARALLGQVRELTAEQLERLGPPYAAGDVGGESGLQSRFERRLAGEPTQAVVLRINGVPTEDLHVVGGERPSRDLQTTLDREVQLAAEEALGEFEGGAALVAVEPSSGDLLAVANRPTDEGFNRALQGRYPPGSTFKIVTAAALLESGAVEPEDVVQCPTSFDVGGREFRNFEGGGGNSMTFAYAFAQSCNTAFISFTDQINADKLTTTAQLFGIGMKPEPALPVYGGQVPPAEDPVGQAATMIGQGEILVSPAGMAAAIAAVADGRWRLPRLVAGDPSGAGDPIDPDVLEQLRGLTRYVVTAGTGAALASVAGEVHGKSGTAEYGSGDPPPTHAWFLAYRDDLAVAALVEGGEAGGRVAAPIVARFFAALDA